MSGIVIIGGGGCEKSFVEAASLRIACENADVQIIDGRKMDTETLEGIKNLERTFPFHARPEIPMPTFYTDARLKSESQTWAKRNKNSRKSW